jgi:hypothetical protein
MPHLNAAPRQRGIVTEYVVIAIVAHFPARTSTRVDAWPCWLAPIRYRRSFIATPGLVAPTRSYANAFIDKPDDLRVPIGKLSQNLFYTEAVASCIATELRIGSHYLCEQKIT